MLMDQNKSADHLAAEASILAIQGQAFDARPHRDRVKKLAEDGQQAHVDAMHAAGYEHQVGCSECEGSPEEEATESPDVEVTE
jgi:hypothetical protein